MKGTANIILGYCETLVTCLAEVDGSYPPMLLSMDNIPPFPPFEANSLMACKYSNKPLKPHQTANFAIIY